MPIPLRNVWQVLPWAINATIIGLLLTLVLESNNDKASIVLIFGYLVLVVANLILWGLLALFKSRFTRSLGTCILFLSLLFVPVLIYALAFV